MRMRMTLTNCEEILRSVRYILRQEISILGCSSFLSLVLSLAIGERQVPVANHVLGKGKMEDKIRRG